MKWAVAAILASTGCDQLFGLSTVGAYVAEPDAEIQVLEDAAVPLDTAGWPTNGGVLPPVCDPGNVADEDADMVNDDCDNCPLDANDQTDADRDGIGDLCDPHPTFAIERLARFEGFNSDVASAGKPLGGTWTVSAGKLHQVGIGIGRTMFVISGAWREPTMHVRFSKVVKNGTVTAFYVGSYQLGESPTSNQADGTQCRVNYSTGASLSMVRIRNLVATGSSTATLTPATATVSMSISARRTISEPPECAAARDIVPAPALAHRLLLTPDPTDPEPASFALWAVSARVDFEAFAIYESTYP